MGGGAQNCPGGALETLTIDRAAALQSDFMERVAGRLEAATEFTDPITGRTFAGRAASVAEFPADFSAEVERVQRATGVYDEVRLERIGCGARAMWEIRPAGLLRFGTEMLVLAGVLPPFRELLLGLTPRARDVDDLMGILPDREAGGPTRVLAVLSPSGWRDRGAPAPVTAAGNDVIYRFEPAPECGYRPYPCEDEWPPAFLALESEEELVARVWELAALRRADLILHGLAARAVSREAGVPVAIVRSAFLRAARQDEFLRAVETDGDLVLRRA